MTRCIPTGTCTVVRSMLCHRDDNTSLFVSLVNIPVSLDNLLQWIASINDWFYLPRFNEFIEVHEIFSLEDCCHTKERLILRIGVGLHLVQLGGNNPGA